MASTKLLACCVFLVAVTVVESRTLGRLLPQKNCQDEYIGKWFEKVSLTVNCDFEWIQARIELIGTQRSVPEYAKIMDLYTQFQTARSGFDNCYGSIRDEIFDLVGGYLKKYSPLSICYTERIVSCRKRARRNIWPELCKYKNLYNQLLALIEEFCGKYSIDTKPRAITQPRVADYSFMEYYPPSPRSKELTILIETCFKDYRYVWDLCNKLPDCGPKRQLIDDVTAIWIEFNNNRRNCDSNYYPRFLDCNEDQNMIDNVYNDYINGLRPFQIKFASCWFDIYTRYEDLCRERNIPITDYCDYDKFTPQENIRGLYFPSQKLQEYFSGQIITPRMDYATCLRQWNELNLKRESPEWKRREKIIRELKRLMREIERIINRLMRDCYRRFMPYFEKCTNFDRFDIENEVMIEEIINNCNNELYPISLEFRENYYDNEEAIMPILKERGITDYSRNIIPCNTFGYDMSVYFCDNDLRELINWIERLFRKNFYGPVEDLVQLKFDENCEEYKLRRKGLKDLECVWMDYRKLLHDIIRRLIKLLRKNKLDIGSDEYMREIKCVREWARPRFITLIDRFRGQCSEVNGVLEKLYEKNSNCKRSYSFVAASFEISIKGSVAC